MSYSILSPNVFSLYRVLLIFGAVLLSTQVHAQKSSLDPSFGEDGKVRLELGRSDGAPADSRSSDVVVQPDGKMILGGYARIDADYSDIHCSLARLLSDGSLDPSFGEEGIVETHLQEACFIAALALQSDGRIVAAAAYANRAFAVLRYMPDGQLDTSFGMGGVVITGIATDYGRHARVSGIALSLDGEVVVVGSEGYEGPGEDDEKFVVARYTADGILDSSFGDGGVLVDQLGASNYEAARDVAIRPDGRIVVAGSSGFATDRSFVLVQYLEDGTRDSAFGDNGVASALAISTRANAMKLQPDGRAVVVGFGGGKAVLVRYTSDGQLDNSFGNGGVATSIGYPGDAAFANDVVILPDGRVLIAGTLQFGTTTQYVVGSFEPDGRPDNSFGTDGFEATSDFRWATGITVAPSGKVVAAGGGWESDGGYSYVAATRYFSTPVAVEEGPRGVEVGLLVPYPNPALSEIQIPFSLIASSSVRLSLYDVLGREVAVITEGTYAAGRHDIRFETRNLPLGAYLLRLRADGEQYTRRLTVVR